MGRVNSFKIVYVAFLFAIWLVPHTSTATVIQGVSSATGTIPLSGTGQAFTGISDLESVSVYASRHDRGGTPPGDYKIMNIRSVRCFDSSALTTLCPASGLDGSGYVLWNRYGILNFTQTNGAVGYQNQRVGEYATITVPFGTKQKIKIELSATTTHVFNPAYFYFFEFGEFVFGADDYALWGATTDVYAPTNFDYGFSTTTTPRLIDMYFEYNETEDTTGSLATTSTTQIPKNIEILEPTYGTTTDDTTFNVSVRFRTPFSIDFRPTTTRTVYITDAVTGELNFSTSTVLEANASESLIYNFVATTTSGSKFIHALYRTLSGDVYSEVDKVFFNVATNTYFLATGLNSPNENPSDLSQIDCDLFDVGCQFQKAITFLFIPSQDTLDKFSNLWQSISNKRPFGYFTVITGQLDALNTTESPAFTLGEIPFMDSIFTPFRTTIAGVLWGVFAIFFFRYRLSKIDI